MGFKLINTNSRRAYKGCKTLRTTNVWKSDTHPFWFIEEIDTQKGKGYHCNINKIHYMVSDEPIGYKIVDFDKIDSDFRIMEVQNIGWDLLEDYKSNALKEITNLHSRIDKINSVLDLIK